MRAKTNQTGYDWYIQITGRNQDLINRRTVWVEAAVNGTTFAYGYVVMYERGNTFEQVRYQGSSLSSNYADIAKGPIMFGCQLSDVLGPAKQPIANWAPGI